MKKANKSNQAQTCQAKDLSVHLAIQMVLSKISTHLLQANNENYHLQFTRVLTFLGSFCHADRCFVLEKGEGLQYYLLSQWLDQWEPHTKAPEKDYPIDLPPEIEVALSSHNLAYFNPGKPQGQGQEHGVRFHHHHTASALIVPLIEGKEVVGCLGMESAVIDKLWEDGDISLLRRSAEYFVATMARIRAEQDKQKSEEKYRQLVEKAPLGIFTVNAAGIVTQLNPKMKKIIVQVGFDLYSPINVLTHKNFIKSGLAKDVRTCLDGDDIPPTIRSYTVPKGQTLYFRTHMTPLGRKGHEITEVQVIVEEITPLFHAEQKLKESERFLTDVLVSLKAGVVIIDPEECKIVDVNPYAAHLIGLEKRDIIGKTCHHFICPEAQGECPLINFGQEMDNSERVLLTHDSTSIPILKSVSRVQHKGKELFLECFTDIRDLKHLLDEQQLDIQASKNILSAINGHFPRYTALKENLTLFSTAFYLPCQAEGGDHFFLRTLTTGNESPLQKTIVSLKDQSGHQVGCILRSVITDLLHQAILCHTQFADVGKIMTRLNEQLDQGRFIDPDSFCTALVLGLDHEPLLLQYTLCGHPRFLLIRDGKAMEIPARSDRQGMNMPLGFAPGLSFETGNISLEKSDKLILFTDGLTEITIGEKDHESSVKTLQPLEILSMLQKQKGFDLSEPVEQIVASMITMVSEISGTSIHGKNKKQNPDDISVIGLEIEDQDEEITEKWYPQDLENLQHKINQFIELQLKKWKSRGFSSFMRLQICMEEAIINAWKHGNKKDPNKAIGIQYRWGNDFHISIEDEGAGFDVIKAPDPCDIKSLTLEFGRGIFMIRRSACEMYYTDRGNKVYMRFSPQYVSLGVPHRQARKQRLPKLWETLKIIPSPKRGAY